MVLGVDELLFAQNETLDHLAAMQLLQVGYDDLQSISLAPKPEAALAVTLQLSDLTLTVESDTAIRPPVICQAIHGTIVKWWLTSSYIEFNLSRGTIS